MEKIAFISGGTFIYWSSIILALAVLAAVCFFAAVYLKKGGRVTPAAAALGTLLKIKPILQIRGEKLDSYAKARTMNQAKKIMLDALRKDIDELFDGNLSEVHLDIAHTQNEAAAMEMKALLEEAFPGCGKITVEPLSLSISCHIGEGALGIACSRKLAV